VAKGPRVVEVDYEKTYVDVCADFIRSVAGSSHSLDIMLVPWASTPPQSTPQTTLPSWIPHISGRAYELSPHSNVYQRVRANPLVGTPGAGPCTYRASGRIPAHSSPSDRQGEFTVRGFSLGVVDSVGDKATHGSIPSSWLDLVGWQEASSPLPQAFWRTLVADRDLDGRSPPPAHFPLACKWAFKRRTQDYDLIT
jgi:hypothetical protein